MSQNIRSREGITEDSALASSARFEGILTVPSQYGILVHVQLIPFKTILRIFVVNV